MDAVNSAYAHVCVVTATIDFVLSSVDICSVHILYFDQGTGSLGVI